MMKLFFNAGFGSQGSAGGHGEVSLRRPGSSEIFPEPIDGNVTAVLDIIPTTHPQQAHVSNNEDTSS
jgi:hypothetical protein